ncbi:MAG: hypothetical protein LBS74_04675 [Oscillospiraceae bacterium]|jgi:uncharacterized protein YjbI with pentapeptide repeats|nr:hypothetical protein [Oscillospiraceae bacterium]
MAFFKQNAQNLNQETLEAEEASRITSPNISAGPRRSFFLNMPEAKGGNVPPKASGFSSSPAQRFGKAAPPPVQEAPEAKEEPAPAPAPSPARADTPPNFKPVIAYSEKHKRLDDLKNKLGNLNEDMASLSTIFDSADKVSLPNKEKAESHRKAKAELSKKTKKSSKKPLLTSSISFSDISAHKNLRWEQVKDNKDLYGIKYPADFDIENADFTGRNIDYSDFSLVEGLRWEHISKASNIMGLVFPSGFDVENAEFFNRNISGCDFSAVYALRWRHIENAGDITAIKYPPTFDIDAARFTGRVINGSDFSMVTALKWEHIKKAAELKAIRYPAGFEIGEAEFSGRDIAESDFSLLSALKWESIKFAKSLFGLIYPYNFDVENSDYAGRDIGESDFTRVHGLRWEHIKFAASIKGVKFPREFDSENADFSALDIQGCNFSRVEGLRFGHIIKAINLQKLIYPPQFDIENADFTDKNIDFSDFSLLSTFNWDAVRLAASRQGVVYPAEFREPKITPEEAQGAAMLFLEKAYLMVYNQDSLPVEDYYSDIKELYPGMDKEKIESLLANARELKGKPSGEKLLAGTVRSSHLGDKLFLTKLAWRVLFYHYNFEEQNEVLREVLLPLRELLLPMFNSTEVDSFDARLENLLAKKDSLPKARRTVTINARAVQPIELPEEEYQEEYEEEPSPEEPADIFTPAIKHERPLSPEDVRLPDFSPPAAARPRQEAVKEDYSAPPIIKEAEAEPIQELSEDEIKAIRTGVMGMLLYIKRNVSDEALSFAELSSTFLQLYPEATIKDASAMAQFSSSVLGGADSDMKSKLFAFAVKAETAVKRKLLNFAYEQCQYRLSTLEDEESFKEFLLTLCDTIFGDLSEYEYTEFLRSKEILKKVDPNQKISYRIVPFENKLGRVNVYANENYPFYKTLERVGFSHFTFQALSGSLYIELSDNRFYEDTAHLVTREVEPNLLEFLVIDSQLGFLYVEQRTLSDWGIDAATVWRAAENNMADIKYKVKYVFASVDTTPYRFIQHDLADYVVFRKDLLARLSGGRDLIFGMPCREIVYIDKYSFEGVKAMLDLIRDYNCTVYVEDEPYEHPVSSDVFIYRAEDGSLERVNDNDYIMLGDTETRRQILRSAAPQEDFTDFTRLLTPYNTDEVYCLTEDEYVVQEAVYTALKLYAYHNGLYDYTIAENALMAVLDDVYISFDAQYPAPSGRYHPDPMDHLTECAAVIAKAGKKVHWLLIQAFEKICRVSQYETPTATEIRRTVMNRIYGESANILWLSCGAAEDFENRFAASSPLHEQLVENVHLYFLDTEVEMVMHLLTLLFHQHGKRYALGQVRRHILRILPNIRFTYEQSQSAWLPEQGANLDVEIQSLGMILRGFDAKTRERVLQGAADAIGDGDLANCGWPLLVFTKLVKSAYLGPEEVIHRCFASRSRMIPNGNALKALNYKDINAEFVKHSRISLAEGVNKRSMNAAAAPNGEPELDDIADPLVDFDYEQNNKKPPLKPELCFAPVTADYLRDELNFVLESAKNQASQFLHEAAEYYSSIYHVAEMQFVANNDVEAELFNGVLRRYEQLTTLRSMAWTCGDIVRQKGKDLTNITEDELLMAADYVHSQNRLSYRSDNMFPALCGTPVNQGLFIPVEQEYLFFAQTQVPNMPLASLLSLQQELIALVPVINLIYEILRRERRNYGIPPEDLLSDTLCAWCAMALSCEQAFSIAEGPAFYNFPHIKRV